MKHIIITLFALAAAAALPACKAPYTMETPASFRKYEDTKEFKMITANGVMLKAREVDNYPKGDLPFWTDAMGRHLEARGYLLKETACFTTNAGKKGCTLTFLLPHGTEDWTFAETLFVEDDDIVLVEAAGPYDRFAKIEGELARALKTFEPRPK